LAHVSTARPVSAALVGAVQAEAERVAARLARGLACACACVEGSRLGMQVESHLLRRLGCHPVGTTNLPEVFLAREAPMACATAGLVTDHDRWLDDPAQHPSVGAIFERYGRNLSLARQVLDEVLRAPLPEPGRDSRQAQASAVLTHDGALGADQSAWLPVLRA
jgi:5'-methylthioadenosine phosphorylase